MAPAQRPPATFLPRLLDDFSEALLTLGVPADAGQKHVGTSRCSCNDECTQHSECL